MKALVTGGGGFLGAHIVEQLLDRGISVRIFARGSYPSLVMQGVEAIRGDLRNQDEINRACAGMDVVFHIAARAGHWGSWDDYYQANVVGTRNVIAACRQNRVHRLVNCSSPSVIFDNRAHEGVDESYPYPETYESPYPHTKALAEQEVTRANSTELLTVSLRPHLIIGPRDRHLLPSVLKAARSGTLPQVGDGTNRVDISYVEDVARAFLQAADRLKPGSPVAGSVYFISQDEPVVLWPWIHDLLARLAYPPVRLRLPLSTARAIGGALESIHRVFKRRGEPRLTRFLASELALSHWYNISRARTELGYQPQFSMAQALDKTLAAIGSEQPGD
ncbi:MAG: NAD-dependent epimerase/dehydratase family protein [Anaerolineae bacterium]|nr:NAD-dependent epimerase/dehydratase family protein [Anaerolineae bacterium]